MKRKCVNKNCLSNKIGMNIQPRVVKNGPYRRLSDSKDIQRYRCKICGKGFSSATFSLCFNQKKRRENFSLLKLFVNGVSQRSAGRMLGLNKNTVAKKFSFLGDWARLKNERYLERYLYENQLFKLIQFDELQTIEHTKLKPLAVPLAVCGRKRKILGFEVSSMPATGLLAEISREKYGVRPDHRQKGLDSLFEGLKTKVHQEAHFTSDQHSFYPKALKKHFPKAVHRQMKGRESCVAGQGELKKVVFDPLFSLNHTCAMMRAHINRLIRKTWCTTKDPKRLSDHIAMYVYYHNRYLTA
jgi:transposase-like protein